MAKTRPTKSELEDLWGHKNDDDLRVAAEELGDFTELARQVIRAEMKRRWGTSTGVCAGESTPNTYSRELSGVTPTPEIIDIYRPNERAFGPRPTINTSPIQRRFFQSWRRHWLRFV